MVGVGIALFVTLTALLLKGFSLGGLSAMLVVNHAHQYIGPEVNVAVDSVVPTSAGEIIFGSYVGQSLPAPNS